jgi:hypothetical protein
MSFFDFVGAMGAGGGEMARTISDIQRRKLEEQEAMDRIAMQREQMASADARQQAGFDFDTNMFDAEGVRATEALAESRRYDDQLNPNFSTDEDGNITHLPYGKTTAGIAERKRFKNNMAVQAQSNTDVLGQIAARAAAAEAAATALDTRGREATGRRGAALEFISRLQDNGMDMDATMGSYGDEYPPEVLDEISSMAAIMLEDRNAASLTVPESLGRIDYGSSSVASSVEGGGNTVLGGTEGGPSTTWAQRLGSGAANLFPEGIAMGFGATPDMPLPSNQEVSGWAGARTLESYRKTQAANKIRSDLEAKIIDEATATRLLTQLEAAGGN